MDIIGCDPRGILVPREISRNRSEIEIGNLIFATFPDIYDIERGEDLSVTRFETVRLR